MSFYLSITDVHPIGLEGAEFLDDPTGIRAEHDSPAPPGDGPEAAEVRSYVGPGITVHWVPDRCVHAGRCISGAPAVFDETVRPWARPDAAPADEIAATVDTCPSGALSYTRTDRQPNGRRGRSAEESPAASIARDPEFAYFPDPSARTRRGPVTSISPLENGPLVVRGPIELTRPDGTAISAERLSLCRCGQSGSKPNCDGSHVRVGFEAPGVVEVQP
jgi:uncharacterized Fe-S cluster protein YjdI/CDGSH-type Zn-finger protein